MACNCCCRRSSSQRRSEGCTAFKRWVIMVLYGCMGWALFSYVEDDLNIIDCFGGLDAFSAKYYPNETRRAERFFARMEKLTNQTLSANESLAVYLLFKSSFEEASSTVDLDKGKFKFNHCIKWCRFSLVTITTIGYGSITPKTDKGKMLLIPYALFGIPLVLGYLASIGSIVSKWTTSIMMCMHKLIKGNKPLKYKSIKQCFYIFLLMWFIIIIAVLEFVFTPGMLKSWLDGIYFYFVTFTTIGFGDIIGPSADLKFYGTNLFLGLSIISGVVDSFLKLTEHIKIGVTCKGLSCHYIEEDNEEEIDVQEEQAIEDTAL